MYVLSCKIVQRLGLGTRQDVSRLCDISSWHILTYYTLVHALTVSVKGKSLKISRAQAYLEVAVHTIDRAIETRVIR